MQKRFKDVDFLFPIDFIVDEFLQIPSNEPFSAIAINYLDALAKTLLKDKKAKVYPDVATFAFFCRKGNIVKLKEKHTNTDILRLGRGIVFHVAPSNVPVNFAYSFLCGILSGNTNIVRVPSKHFEQIDIIINAIKKLSKEPNFKAFSKRMALVRYDRQNTATNYFSSICDVRIIWGGDQTIQEIRNNKLPARSFDITFADRYSLCIIDADKYKNEENPEKIASAFYNDTYLFDQNACTAPHLLIWLGSQENVKQGKKVFWEKLHQIVKSKYEVQPVIAVDKLTSLFNQAIHSKVIKKEDSQDNLIWRIKLDSLNQDIDQFRCTCGYFSEYHAASLAELAQIVNRKYQTLAYYGIEKTDLQHFIRDEKPSGIDRIVPIGKTMDFSLTWDGFDLINALSRCCEIV